MESDKKDGGTHKLLFEDLDKEVLRLIWFEVSEIADNRLREFEFVRLVKGMLIALGVSERISASVCSNVQVEFVEGVEVGLPVSEVKDGDVIVEANDSECECQVEVLIVQQIENFYLRQLVIHIATNKRRVDKRSLLLMRCSVRYKVGTTTTD